VSRDFLLSTLCLQTGATSMSLIPVQSSSGCMLHACHSSFYCTVKVGRGVPGERVKGGGEYPGLDWLRAFLLLLVAY